MQAIDQKLMIEVLLGVGLIVLFALGFRVISVFRQEAKGELRRQEDALAPYREALAAGMIDRAEYDRLAATVRPRPGGNPERRADAFGLVPPATEEPGGARLADD